VAEERGYLLGTDDDELARLGFQHQLWAADAAAAWARAGFGPGQSLLDVGCGPGYATLDLARLAGPAGSVHGVDVSERFVAHLRARAAALGARNVTAQLLDLAAGDLPASAFDGAYAGCSASCATPPPSSAAWPMRCAPAPRWWSGTT
jgi:ubiquinone/menaquinone biosynthesis C-methylase UbiE